VIPRAAVAPIVAAAVVLVAVVGGSSPAAQPDPVGRSIDLLASAHPTSWKQSVTDRAYDVTWSRDEYLKADAAALASATCEACVGESTTLQVVYARSSRRARLDNVANAWTQECRSCRSMALSVQVVVLRGGPVTVPNNRALAVTAGCEGCGSAALAFQVVLVAADAVPLSALEMADLRAWVDEQATALRASVTPPLVEQELPPSPSPSPTETATPTASPTLTPETLSPAPLPTRAVRSAARARRDALSALGELEDLLADALDAETVVSDVELSR
jgi:hypothetical protein